MPLTPNNREEHWLQGMVDGSTDLTPNKRREYWQKEIIDAQGGGGGGGGVTIATYSSEDGATFTCDMTLAQILGVFASGGFVVAYNEWTGNYDYPVYVSEADENVTYNLSTIEYKNEISVSVAFENINHTGDGISGSAGYGYITGYTPE